MAKKTKPDSDVKDPKVVEARITFLKSKLRTLVDALGTQKEVLSTVGVISPSLATAWLGGRVRPTYENAIRLAYLECTLTKEDLETNAGKWLKACQREPELSFQADLAELRAKGLPDQKKNPKELLRTEVTPEELEFMRSIAESMRTHGIPRVAIGVLLELIRKYPQKPTTPT